MANNQLTFADRERAARLFGTTSGYSQGNAPASASQLKSAQTNYQRAQANGLTFADRRRNIEIDFADRSRAEWLSNNTPSYSQGNASGGRLTQSQIEKAQRYAKSMGLNFNPSSGYYKGTKPSSSPSSAQRSAQRKAKSAATGNTISKGGAAGLAGAFGQYDTLAEKSLMAKTMFNPGSLTDADKEQLGMTELIPKVYDNVPSGGVFDMVAEGRDPSKKYYSDGIYAGQVLSTTVPSLAIGNQTSITSGLQGLSMAEKDRLSSQGLLGSYMTGNQSGYQMGSLMGTSALNSATGGYFG